MNIFFDKKALLLSLILGFMSVFSSAVLAATSDCTYDYEGNLIQNVRISLDDDLRGPITRTFDYYVPDAAYPAAAYNQLPLVFVLHGRGASADVIFGTDDYFDWGYPWCQMMKEADQAHFIICAPDGWENSFGEKAWNDCRIDDPYSPGTNDVLFINELIRWFAAQGYNINLNKVYAAGFSNGAGMVFRLAAELSDQIAAVAAVGSIMPRPSYSECGAPVEKVGIFLMNGTNDSLVPYEHSQSAVDYWLLYNNMLPNAEVVRLPDNVAFPEEPNTNLWTVLDRYTASPDDLEGTQVCLYTVHNGGHCEPSIAERYPDYYKYDLGAGFQCHDFEVAEEVWKFFRNQWLTEERTYRPTQAYAAIGSGTGEIADLWLDEEDESGSYIIDGVDGVAMLSATFSLLESTDIESVRVTAVSRTSMPVSRSLLVWNTLSGKWDEIVADTAGAMENMLEATRTLNASVYVSANGQIKAAVRTDDVNGGAGSYQLFVELFEVGVVPGASYDPPVAVDDEYEVSEGAVLTVDGSSILDNDLSAGAMTAVLVDDVQNGTLDLLSDGTFTYEPAPRFSGSDFFTYQADELGVRSTTATVAIEVLGTNLPPIAQDDYIVAMRNNSVTSTLVANDTDPDGAIDPATVAITSQPNRGGTVVVSGDGAVTYSPPKNFWGTEAFSYTVADNEGSISNVALVTVDVRRSPKGNYLLWLLLLGQ